VTVGEMIAALSNYELTDTVCYQDFEGILQSIGDICSEGNKKVILRTLSKEWRENKNKPWKV